MKHLLLTTIAAVVLVGTDSAAEIEPKVPLKLSEPLLFSFAQMCDTQLGMGGYEHDVKTFGLAVTQINKMKQILLTTIAAVVLVGCGTTQQVTVQAPDISIHDAAKIGNIEAIKQHLVAGADVDFRNQQGFTPLHVAAQKGHNKVAELLIAKGANINTSGRLIGTTPLDSAALLGHKEMVELLIDSGADINPQIITGETPLQRAEQRGHSAIAEILRKHGGRAGKVTLLLAILKGQKDVAKSLIKGGAVVNAKGPNDLTPLHLAIQQSQREIAELLIARDADVNAKAVNDLTSLHLAVVEGGRKMVELLISNGANLNARESQTGMTALHYAFMNDDLNIIREVVKLLIARGADVNAKNTFGATPLDVAKNHPETADLLRKHGGKTGEELK